jgi:hypothetical protein
LLQWLWSFMLQRKGDHNPAALSRRKTWEITFCNPDWICHGA